MERFSRAKVVSLRTLDKEREICFLLLTLIYLLRELDKTEPLFFPRVHREIEEKTGGPPSPCVIDLPVEHAIPYTGMK